MVFFPQDTFRLVAIAETRERGGGRGGGERVQAVRGDESGPRPILFSACTLILCSGQKNVPQSKIVVQTHMYCVLGWRPAKVAWVSVGRIMRWAELGEGGGTKWI